MGKLFLTAFIITVTFCSATAQNQKQPPLTQTSIVKDSSGTVIPYEIWTRLILTGRYKVTSQVKQNDEFIIFRLSDEEYQKNLESLPKPKESKFFRTGSNFPHFKTTDINNNKINTKTLSGKIIVLNFWFINCPPCIMEMPELNKLVDFYKTDSSVVFMAIALDKKYELDQFLKRTAFKYTVIDEGRYLADQYRITSYPTNVIIDQKGKVYFHSSGLTLSTAHWLKKSIDELKGKSLARTESPNNQ